MQQARNTARQKKRHAERRRICRRRRFVEQAMATIAPDIFLPEEAVDLFFGPLTDAKRAVKRAGRRQLVTAAGEYFLEPAIQTGKGPPSAPRPVHVISRLNGSAIFPPLVPSQIHLAAISVDEILAALRIHYHDSPPHHLLDALATVSGMGWESCAEILLAHKLLKHPIDRHDLAATRSARSFWNQYCHARVRYSALVFRKEILRFQGDWGYFEDTELVRLLPGITIPAKLRREHYLTNWLKEGDQVSLDVYAASTFVPLFQHPFLDRFNPLRFGKPRPDRDWPVAA